MITFARDFMPTNPGTRTEKDSIGSKEIPADAYYGIQTLRAVENYPISGMRAHPTLIRAFGMVKRAAAEAISRWAWWTQDALTRSSKRRRK